MITISEVDTLISITRSCFWYSTPCLYLSVNKITLWFVEPTQSRSVSYCSSINYPSTRISVCSRISLALVSPLLTKSCNSANSRPLRTITLRLLSWHHLCHPWQHKANSFPVPSALVDYIKIISCTILIKYTVILIIQFIKLSKTST